MSEMLANQYFMARKFLEAEIELEGVIEKNPSNKFALKKLVVCYTHNNKIEQALKILLELITDDINFIIDTDPIDDDCPCFELINEVEHKNLYKNNSPKYFMMLGIFWLYCNFENSLINFQKALQIESENKILIKLYNKIKAYSDNVHSMEIRREDRSIN